MHSSWCNESDLIINLSLSRLLPIFLCSYDPRIDETLIIRNWIIRTSLTLIDSGVKKERERESTQSCSIDVNGKDKLEQVFFPAYETKQAMPLIHTYILMYIYTDILWKITEKCFVGFPVAPTNLCFCFRCFLRSPSFIVINLLLIPPNIWSLNKPGTISYAMCLPVAKNESKSWWENKSKTKWIKAR